MLRRSCYLLIVLMVLAGNALAVTSYSQWSGTAGDGQWNTAGNWTAVVGVPYARDAGGVMGNPNYKAGFKGNVGTNYPNLSSGTATTDILVTGGGSLAVPGHFVVSGATLNVSEYITLAAATNDFGLMTVNSGTVNTGVQYNNAQFYVSQKGTGVLQMNGGIINVGSGGTSPSIYSGNLAMSSTVAGETTGIGTLYLDGGIIYANDLIKGNGTGSQNFIITNGQLVLKTDRTTEINGYITAGWLKAGAGYALQTTFDAGSGTTIVNATIPEPATMCLLGFGVMGLLRKKR
jgi:hypothetical protein